MAAWTHVQYWTHALYASYRQYVTANAPTYEGDTRDCADLSVTLLIEFAASNGLPLTFYDNADVMYVSKAERQHSKSYHVHVRSWKNKDEYSKAIQARIGASSLFNQNMEPNPRGPEAGDLMIKQDHAALIFRAWPPGVSHPLANQYDIKGGIPKFPGAVQAAKELNQTKYFRDDPTAPVQSKSPHIDFLNHRGEGHPTKARAELMFFADVQDMRKGGFLFYRYRNLVLDNWQDWDGRGDPPH